MFFSSLFSEKKWRALSARVCVGSDGDDGWRTIGCWSTRGPDPRTIQSALEWMIGRLELVICLSLRHIRWRGNVEATGLRRVRGLCRWIAHAVTAKIGLLRLARVQFERVGLGWASWGTVRLTRVVFFGERSLVTMATRPRRRQRMPFFGISR